MADGLEHCVMIALDTCEIESAPACVRTSIELPLGLLGFERFKRYALTAEEHEAPFQWLEVEGDASLSFLVVSPFEVLPEYAPELAPEDVAYIGLERPEDARLFGIVTLRSGGRATINLKGPVVVHRRTLRGKQVILANAAAYSLRQALPLPDNQ